MLEMIFANSDFPEYDYYLKPNENQNNYKQHSSPKYHVGTSECMHQVRININDDDQDWGYYIDLDTSTPPTVNYLKNKNISPTLNLPKKNITAKPIKYLPVIEEEIYYTNNQYDSNNIKSYMVDEASTTSSVISTVTFCATVAFYYFYRSMRN